MKRYEQRHVFVKVRLELTKDVPAPFVNRPKDDEFYSKKDPSKPDLEFLRDFFINEGRLTIRQATFIIKKATDIMRKEPAILDLDAPLTGAYRLT